MNGDAVATAVWADDTDEDGVSDLDEIAAGTDPNDAKDVPNKRTIRITVLNSDGSYAGAHTLVLNSTPVFATTGLEGEVVYTGVFLSPHTLSLRNGMTEIGRYTLSFTEGTDNTAAITGGGSGVSVTNNPLFLSLDITIQLDITGTFAVITEADISEKNPIDNPKTGEY